MCIPLHSTALRLFLSVCAGPILDANNLQLCILACASVPRRRFPGDGKPFTLSGRTQPDCSMPPPPGPPHFASAATPPALPSRPANGVAAVAQQPPRQRDVCKTMPDIASAILARNLGRGLNPSVCGQSFGDRANRDRLARSNIERHPIGLAVLASPANSPHHVMHADKIAQLFSVLKDHWRAAGSAIARQKSPPLPCTDSKAPAVCRRY